MYYELYGHFAFNGNGFGGVSKLLLSLHATEKELIIDTDKPLILEGTVSLILPHFWLKQF